MRQVPNYLIIGNGQVASHFRHYFSLLHLPYTTWHRHQDYSLLNQALEKATHILLLISDDSIDTFIAENLKHHANIIHFSGSLVTDHAYGAHPLMTFNDSLYDLAQYQAIPFVIDDDAPHVDELLPGLANPHIRLHKSLKPKYHALCVMSGNFSCLLWQKFFTTLEQEFNIPHSFAHLYLQQQTKNLLSNHETALTGPLARGDDMTLEKNMAALSGDAFQSVYKSFVQANRGDQK